MPSNFKQFIALQSGKAKWRKRSGISSKHYQNPGDIFSLQQMLMTLCNASCGRINFIPPTGLGQPNRDPGSPLLSSSCLLYLFPKGDCFQSIYMHLSQLPPLAASGNTSFHNKLKWKCRCEKAPPPDKRHVPTWAARTKLHLLLNPSRPKPHHWNTDELCYNSAIK